MVRRTPSGSVVRWISFSTTGGASDALSAGASGVGLRAAHGRRRRRAALGAEDASAAAATAARAVTSRGERRA